MEELLLTLLQFLFEFALEILGNIPFDWPSRHRTTPEPGNIALGCLLWFSGGCLLAGASLLIVQHSLIALPALRMANLGLAPIVSAVLSQTIAKHRAKHNPYLVPRNHFWQAFWFTLGLVLIRFMFASRA